jgi:hypothetical protein
MHTINGVPVGSDAGAFEQTAKATIIALAQ